MKPKHCDHNQHDAHHDDVHNMHTVVVSFFVHNEYTITKKLKKGQQFDGNLTANKFIGAYSTILSYCTELLKPLIYVLDTAGLGVPIICFQLYDTV